MMLSGYIERMGRKNREDSLSSSQPAAMRKLTFNQTPSFDFSRTVMLQNQAPTSILGQQHNESKFELSE
jgi:hypothetical protein